ncbi:MAG: macro domain-containing protein [Clostridia bacterium]|nr:macro domain-containing protein [Clostridia bacterium]
MSTISIKKSSITDLDTDAIVNAANEGLLAGGGVCGAVFQAAGYEKLQKACDRIGHCDTGSAVITPGFDLKAKYIIHAVGPRWRDGKHNEPELLYGAYYRSLELAVENKCRSIGFPLISAGIFGYPAEYAWYRAFAACRDFLDKHKGENLDIVFAVLSDEIYKTGHKAFMGSGASRYKIAERNDWNIKDMPDRHDSFIFRRPFSAGQMEALRRGNIPQEMEDKWFWYTEGDTLYAHRSWTGFCIYRIDFRPDNDHIVTVNRDPEQYKCTSTAEDAQTLNKLLNWWTQDNYDYYHEWLSETADSLKKAGKIPDKLRISGS